MKTLVTLLACILSVSTLFAQKFIREFYIELPGLGNYAQATAILSTEDGNLLIAGPSNSSSSIGTMFYMKTDTSGNVLWTTFAEEQFNSTAQYASKLLEDKDNNYVMAGRYGPYEGNTYFTKISPGGQIIKTTVSNGENGYESGYDAEQTADGGYLVAAQKSTYGTGISMALRKLDASGGFKWDTSFVQPDDSYLKGRFLGMDKINDSTFVLTGQREYTPGSAEDLDVLLAKVQLSGDTAFLMKLKIFQEDGSKESGHDILILPDDQGYIICGTGPDPSFPDYTDGIIMRTDTAGNLIWKKSYTRALNSNTTFLKILRDGDDNILALAQTQAGSSDASLLKYSPEGELLQKTHFDFGLNETAYDLAINPEGKIFISVGTLYFSDHPLALLLKVKDVCPLITPEAVLDNTTPDIGSDIVVSLSNTNEAWEYSLIQISGNTTLETTMGNGGDFNFTVGGLGNDDVADGLVVSVIEPGVDCIKYSDTLFLQFVDGIEDIYQNSLRIAPNPGHDFITITDKEHKLAKLTVYNINGQFVLEENALSEHNRINLSALPKGMYIFRITYREGVQVFRKVVKD
ncbi:MAG: T9SS type A sorting domain-containing protein [Bacteroidales bacterium]|nr:T9SS type A sorting domain-containing protein [Bacteroidales bacterium]